MSPDETTLDLSQARSKQALHNVLAKGLGFPNYYGMNWDAFWDCVRDDDQSRLPRHLVLAGMAQLQQALPREAEMLRRLLRELQQERPSLRVTISDGGLRTALLVQYPEMQAPFFCAVIDLSMKFSALSTVCAGLSAVCGALGCLLAWVAWQRAGLPYNEEGHYFDGLVNHHQQSVLVYGVLAFLALLLALGLAWVHLRARRR